MNIELRRARNRQMLIFMLVCIGMLTLLGRLYYWQVVESNSGYHLAQLASAEHVQNQILNAPRGLIYDAQGRILATNVVRDDVYIEPIQFTIDHSAETYQSDLDALVSAIHSVLPSVAKETLKADFKSASAAVNIARSIEPEQSQKLRAMRLPDIFLDPHTVRVYPDGTLAAQILGFVQSDTNHGVYGIESQYDALLAGKAGSFSAETDLNGNPLIVGPSAEQQPVSGANLTLTIDSAVEYMVESALAQRVQQVKAASGTIVVLNARTGAVVALAGYPTFDPNHYGQYANETGCLHTEGVFLNPALFCAYEPGSTMKAVTMSAALDQGLITPDTSFTDPGYIRFNDAPTVYNWADLAYGTETMTQVLEHSANVGAAHVAHDILGASRYYPYVARFGFGQHTGIDAAEEVGNYRTPANSPQVWTPSDLTRQAFGQSIEATPLQVALAYEAIANGGVMMRPYLVAAINGNGHITTVQPRVVRRVISAHASQLLTQMLEQVVLHGLATDAAVPGYTVAAKTGTATTQGLSTDQTEASVAGFLPASNPQFVILVKIDRPQQTIYGGTAAGPLWESIAQQLMWYYHIPPQ